MTRVIALWQAAVYGLSALLIGAGLGIAYQSGRQAGKESAAETVDQVAGQAVTVADTTQVKTLKTQLSAARAEAAAFQRKLQEAARANPAPVDCRLPDGLRDDLNR
ncbi:hypothetical protein [Cupriavidus alkaliphilus]|uniref:Uncharacterized protein HemX n=1 Tax=Cupriavidus alkaliphilus TaxID=942866 RepID=A0A7W4VGQ3_9BURK|nr:hypothetical protein [Cupriavidus alkaliphilus]MBB3010645.1 uncharacterized protein HemX [Cupriavidus alkaliphilus]